MFSVNVLQLLLAKKYYATCSQCEPPCFDGLLFKFVIYVLLPILFILAVSYFGGDSLLSASSWRRRINQKVSVDISCIIAIPCLRRHFLNEWLLYFNGPRRLDVVLGYFYSKLLDFSYVQ